MSKLLHSDEVYAVVGAAIAVYNELGHGFLEAVYQEAFELELSERHIGYTSQFPIAVRYKGTTLRKHYYADVFAYGNVLVEIKALTTITSVDESQLLNYMKASHVAVGLLINFGSPHRLQWKRMVRTQP